MEARSEGSIQPLRFRSFAPSLCRLYQYYGHFPLIPHFLSPPFALPWILPQASMTTAPHV